MKKQFLKYFISFGLLAFLVWKLDFELVLKAISGVNLLSYLFAALVWFVALALKTKRWNFFLPNHNFFDLYKYTFVSIYYGSVLTGPVVGDGAKAYRLIQRDKGQAKEIVSSVVIENITHYAAAPLAGIIGLFFVVPPYQREILFTFILAFVVFMVMIIGGQYVAVKFAEKMDSKKTSRMIRVLSPLLSAFAEIGTQKTEILWSLALGIFVHLLCAAVNYIIFFGLGIGLNFFDFCWINAAMAIIMLFPVTIAGLGLREVGMVSLLGLLGVGANDAMAGILVVFSIQIIGAFIGFIIDICAEDKLAKTIEAV